MNFGSYQKEAMRTKGSYSGWFDELVNGIMGLNGESGEAIDIVKKTLYQGHAFDRDSLIKELGDVLWYIALCADALGIGLEDIAEENKAKLRKRYPVSFSYEDSVNREVANE